MIKNEEKKTNFVHFHHMNISINVDDFPPIYGIEFIRRRPTLKKREEKFEFKC